MGGYILSKQKSIFQQLIDFFAPKPDTVNGVMNSSYFFYETQLYEKLQGLYSFEGLPEEIDLDYLYDTLFRFGALAFFKWTDGNYYLLKTSYTGYNEYHKPVEAYLENPILGHVSREIGRDCELLYIGWQKRRFITAQPLIERYATLLASADATINTNLINSRTAFVFEAANDADVQTAKEMYDEMTMGKPAIFKRKSVHTIDSQPIFTNVKNIFIGSELMNTKRLIMNEFLTEIGIPSVNVEKKERLITDEVNSGNAESDIMVKLWLACMNRCFERINTMFGTNIKASLNLEKVQQMQEEMNEPTKEGENV